MAAVLALLLLPALAACQGTSGVAASVNGHVITRSSVNSELEAIKANTAYRQAIESSQTKVIGSGASGTFDLAFTDKVLARQILLELVHDEVLRRHLVVTAADIAAAKTQQSAQIGPDPVTQKPLFDGFSPAYQGLLARRGADVAALQAALSPVKTDDATIQKFYNDNAAKLYTSTCASHILVADQATADQLHAQLVAGADFATLARTKSTDSGSAAKGGDLGCNPPGTFVPEFEQAEQALAVGQLSAVVHSQFGYHIIKVTGRNEQPLANVRAQIIQQLQSQGQTQLSQFVQDAAGKAKVKLDPRYGTFIGTGTNAGTIQPPNVPAPSAGGVTLPSPTTSIDQTGQPGTGQPGSAPPTSSP